LDKPSLASNRIRARCASPAWIAAEGSHASSRSRSPNVSHGTVESILVIMLVPTDPITPVRKAAGTVLTRIRD
jgi:hypothetical protein